MLKRTQRNRLASQARTHKDIARRRGEWWCVECKSKDNLESDHILSQKWHPELRFKLWNLCLRCKTCNLRKGAKMYMELRTLRVIFIASLRGAFWPSLLVIAVLIAQQYPEVFAFLSNIFWHCLESFSILGLDSFPIFSEAH